MSGKTTYSTWATDAFSWTTRIGLIDGDWNVLSSANVSTNCFQHNGVEASVSTGSYVVGAAYMFNMTMGDLQLKWKEALDGLTNTTIVAFFPSGVAIELSCELLAETCTTDEKAYKGMLSHWLTDTMRMAPHTTSVISNVTTSMAVATAGSCVYNNSTSLSNGCAFT